MGHAGGSGADGQDDEDFRQQCPPKSRGGLKELPRTGYHLYLLRNIDTLFELEGLRKRNFFSKIQIVYVGRRTESPP